MGGARLHFGMAGGTPRGAAHRSAEHSKRTINLLSQGHFPARTPLHEGCCCGDWQQHLASQAGLVFGQLDIRLAPCKQGMEANAAHLAGEAIAHDDGSLRRFPASELPPQPAARFVALFVERRRWAADDIKPYLAGLEVKVVVCCMCFRQIESAIHASFTCLPCKVAKFDNMCHSAIS